MDDLSSLLTGENAALIGALVVTLSTMKAMLPRLFNKPMMLRFLPMIPILMGIVAVFCGFGEAGDALSGWQDKLVLGCLVGFTSGQLYKAGRTSIFGFGLGSKEATAPSAPADPADRPGAAEADASSDQKEGD